MSAALILIRDPTRAGTGLRTGTTTAARMREDLAILDFEPGEEEEERAAIGAALRA